MKNLHNISFGNKKIIKKKKCVLCFSDRINTVLDFKKTPLANSYKKDINDKDNFFKLSCVLCANCGHLQLSHLTNPKIIFEDYLYISGTSKVLKKHFIDCRIFYPNLSNANQNKSENKNVYKNSDNFEKFGLYLPSGPDLNLQSINKVSNIIKKFYKK